MSKVVSLAEYRRRRDADATVRTRRDRPKHLTRGTLEERLELATRGAEPDNDNGSDGPESA